MSANDDSTARFAAALPCGGLEPSPAIPLRAGSLTLLYESGAVRIVRRGGVEILRMVYAAVRDENWRTIPGRIENERIVRWDDGFLIEYDCLYERGPISFRASFGIEGGADGRLAFSMRGEAKSDFLKNRIGICVLHPIAECAGRECTVVAPDGSETRSRFPEPIAPHQPFLNMRGLRWHPSPDCKGTLEFAGDIFETEDQRNWTDASYKTYSTPLALPIPAAVRAGERVEQSVVLRVESSADPAAGAPASDDLSESVIRFTPTGEPERPLPPIGMTAAAGRFAAPDFALEPAEIAAVRALNLAHLRVEAHLYRQEWRTNWNAALREAGQFGLPVAVAAFFGDAPDREADVLLDALRELPMPLVSLLLLQHGKPVLPDAAAASLLPALRAALPDVPVGLGTDRNFAELNRNRPAADVDFLSWSACPQMHVVDTRSIVENLAALAETIRSARAFGGDRRLHVGPVTLKRRCLDETGNLPASLPGELPWNVDARQMSLFGAGWTLVGVKYLAESGADSLTYGEVAEMRGLFLPSGAPHVPAFPAMPGAFFPAYFVRRELLADPSALVVPWRSSDPLRVDGLALRSSDGSSLKLLLANLTAEPQRVKIPAAPVRLGILDSDAALKAATRPADFHAAATPGAWTAAQTGYSCLTLPPYAVAALDVAPEALQ